MRTTKARAYSLTAADAAQIKAMLARRDLQSQIAAYFGVNVGRISEIKKGRTFRHVLAATTHVPAVGAPPVHTSESLLHDIVRRLDRIEAKLAHTGRT